ncbi:hypothetical protein [Tritonibacter horizontis]|uniref:Nucleotidyl transferase AbiEii toxin, Type IV TA system n=1 Tax=Tritonibacter horizontis TaxID=1768241 RepID=A0A132BT83_9RHOB|nr:hypothetical protein [Tritonibacter horizontis]KUP91591.1 hypothetical protein TRIHO_35480 [Tritonibacter horizontis]
MTTVTGQLLQMLETVADALGAEFRERLVFVGGCTTALFITDTVTLEDVRATDDVDLIVDLAGYAAWAEMQNQLREKGFSESPEDEVICRMRLGELKVDFMPDDESILGFSNRWYSRGIETAVIHQLTAEMEIKLLLPELFIATKLEAYIGRGGGDLIMSRDIEDILLVVDGREELIAEIQNADEDIQSFIAEQFRKIQQDYEFENFLTGNIRGPEGRVRIVQDRFSAISATDSGG